MAITQADYEAIVALDCHEDEDRPNDSARPSSIAYLFVKCGVPAQVIAKHLRKQAEWIVAMDECGRQGAGAAILAFDAAKNAVTLADAVSALTRAGESPGCKPSPSPREINGKIFEAVSQYMKQGEAEERPGALSRDRYCPGDVWVQKQEPHHQIMIRGTVDGQHNGAEGFFVLFRRICFKEGTYTDLEKPWAFEDEFELKSRAKPSQRSTRRTVEAAE